MKRNKGDILEARDRRFEAGKHYIIFYDGYDDNEFIAGVLTSTDNFPVNILMAALHFEERDKNGNDFKITYKNSKLVPAKLFKPEEWGPFEKVGQLTDEGIAFVDLHIGELQPEYWQNYIQR
ncbi:hypothetical protein BB050_04088 [Flavobacterium anhuiense]|mgnify:CR=1 FL=1|uniref:Uncharacterized protein n=1 Tax=Flavobacterium anhuiense TaxID=459526 RepID=A0AAC9D5M6_9FLAO|nr:hypothetical protein [Flavobacterium anhuiense]AOC97166.1 hypothetical protein BB050_04088 [Flavobacterium anhuiense]